jgi:hypothetical protein
VCGLHLGTASAAALPLPRQAAALLDLRYSVRMRGYPYVEPHEGEIDPVWREIEELLPPEMAALLPEDDTKWL